MNSGNHRGFSFLRRVKVKSASVPRRNIYCKAQLINCPYRRNTGKSICCVFCSPYHRKNCIWICAFLKEDKWRTCESRMSKKKLFTFSTYKKIFSPPTQKNFKGVILSTPFNVVSGNVVYPIVRGTNKQKKTPKQKTYKSKKRIR